MTESHSEKFAAWLCADQLAHLAEQRLLLHRLHYSRFLEELPPTREQESAVDQLRVHAESLYSDAFRELCANNPAVRKPASMCL
jgi:hypothetical protein